MIHAGENGMSSSAALRSNSSRLGTSSHEQRRQHEGLLVVGALQQRGDDADDEAAGGQVVRGVEPARQAPATISSPKPTRLPTKCETSMTGSGTKRVEPGDAGRLPTASRPRTSAPRRRAA